MQGLHADIWRIALPMLLAGISTPLIGIVDTAVLGHLDSPVYLAAVAVGAVIFSLLFWMFGFLRMACTSQTARFFGAQNEPALRAILLQMALMAISLAILILLLQRPIEYLVFLLYSLEAGVASELSNYYSIRIWSAPATLLTYVALGWLLGMQMVRVSLFVVIVINLLNVFFDLLFVVVMGMTASGVAWAGLIAEYTGLLIVLVLIWRRLSQFSVTTKSFLPVSELLLMNVNMFIRTIVLLMVFLLFSWQGAQLGVVVLAVNALLLNFQTFMAYVLDAFAHAAESLVGQASGQQDWPRVLDLVRITGWFSLLASVGFSVCYLIFGNAIVAGLSSLASVRLQAGEYLYWLAFMPLAAFSSYWLDGVFIGMGWFREMRQLMLVAFMGFILFWQVFLPWDNHGLWAAMFLFMLLRSGLMYGYWIKKEANIGDHSSV